VASQEPSETPGTLGPYEAGWVAITRALDGGASWSGRERNCAFLNLGDGRFADVSAVSGFDFLDDGRGVLATDWDGDGDLDLWLRNRTGPQLRLLANQAPVGDRWLALELVGTSCNRDAVGARVELSSAPGPQGPWTRHTSQVTAGDGYLSQSSLRQHFGLAPDAVQLEVRVSWPGGEQELIAGVRPGALFRVVEGTGKATAVERARATLIPGPMPTTAAPPGRVVLRTPFPLPPATRRALGMDASPAHGWLLNLWSVDCAPCLGELAELASRHAELEASGLHVLALNVDPPGALERAQAAFSGRIAPSMTGSGFVSRSLDSSTGPLLEAILEHTLAQKGESALPTSLFIDKNGWVQVIYLGPVQSDSLLVDAAIYAPGPRGAAHRGSWPGRWFFGVPRDLKDLAARLTERGRAQDARFYELVGRAQQRSPR
jgi:ASPIC and UnbV